MKSKHFKITAIALFLSSTVYAQPNWLYPTGFVGVNTGASPTFPFELNTDIDFTPIPGLPRKISANNADLGLSIYATDAAETIEKGARIDVCSYGNTAWGGVYKGAVNIESVGLFSSSDYALNVANRQPGTGTNSLMQILKNGNLHLQGDFNFMPYSSGPRNVFGNNSNYGLALYATEPSESVEKGARIDVCSYGNTAASGIYKGCVNIESVGLFSSSDYAMNVANREPGTGTNSLMQVLKNGNMHLQGDFNFMPYNSGPRNVLGNNSSYGLALYATEPSESVEKGARIDVCSYGNTSASGVYKGCVNVESVGLHNSSDYSFNVSNRQPSSSGATTNPLMRVLKNGKVVVGNVPSTSNSYKLFVETGILTEKVKVALSSDPTNWSDFVFADDYELRSLKDVETYINKHKHLPEIPSTEEVHKDGLDLAQMDAKLLQKVEELTLYIIQQQKEIEVLKAKVK